MTELNTLELATVSGGTTKTTGTSATTTTDATTQALTNITSSLNDLKSNQNKGGLDTTTAMCLGLMMSQRSQPAQSSTIIASGGGCGGGGFFRSVTRW